LQGHHRSKDQIKMNFLLAQNDLAVLFYVFSGNNVLFSHLSPTHIICFLLGLILCGIPLSMIVMLSLNSSGKKISLYRRRARVFSDSYDTNNGGTPTTTLPSSLYFFYFSFTGSTVSSATVLPTQCFAYTIITDRTRLHTYESCCVTDYNQATGWYRFMGNGGTRLITTQPSKTNTCNANYPGWWNGTLPMTAGTSTVGNVCFYDGGSSCTNPLSPISATNCSGYYVFYLMAIPCCTSYRYCTTPWNLSQYQ
jgi:hypothetical protein